MNNELLHLAYDKHHFIPTKHGLMSVIPDYMDHDNSKYHVTHNWYPDYRALNLADDVMFRLFQDKFRKCKVKTFEEAIALAEKHTSAGFLYKKQGLPKKGDVFEKAYDILKSMYDDIRSGIPVETVFEVAPKVEIRAIEKLINDDYTKRKQRTFMVGDVLFYVVGLALYSEQNEVLIEDCYSHKSWFAVGISIFHGGWDTLYRILSKTSQIYDTHDETAMECCLMGHVMQLIYNIRHSYFEGVDRNMALWYSINLFFGKVLDHRGKLWLKSFTNPSGQLNTLMDNCLAMIFKLVYHICKSCISVEQVLSKINSVTLKLCGDDDIVPTSPVWDGMIDSSYEIGFLTKNEGLNQNISEVKFLNFGFSYNVYQHQWTFVPNYDKLFSGLFYYRKSNSWRLTLARLFAMKVLCYNDPYYYNQVCDYIDYIMQNFYVTMESETTLDSILPMHALIGQNLSREEIRALIFSTESNCVHGRKLECYAFIKSNVFKLIHA